MDLPNLTEEEEAKLLNAVFDAAKEAVTVAIDRI